MLVDRHYMRQPRFRLPWSATVGLLVANVAVFVLELIHYGSGLQFPSHDYFALSTEGLAHGYLWQLLTYQFMHAGWLHLLFNCWAIFVFGRDVEETLGRRKFLTLYFTSGVIGGLFQTLGGFLVGGAHAAPVVGASASGFGLLAAFAMLYPERPLTLLLFLFIPVSMRAKFLLLFLGLLTVFGIVFPVNNIAHAAHLGGLLTGIIFVRYAIHWHWRLPRTPRARKQPLRASAGAARRNGTPWGQDDAGADDDVPPEEFFSKNVDPILDKISAHGIQSLTERERRILQDARDRMARR
jgi:membrane associated rhomboid family serine protease